MMTKTSRHTTSARLHLKNGRPHLSVPLKDEMILAWAKRIIKKRFSQRRIHLSASTKVREYLVGLLSGEEREVFGCLFLDNDHRFIAYRTLFLGTVNQTNIYPREIIKMALSLNAVAVIAVHNHPSANIESSFMDKMTTHKLTKVLSQVDINLLDHFIVAGSQAVSIMEESRGKALTI